jgi:site-specific recombinase XerD
LKLRAGILLGNYPGADKAANQQCITFNQLWEKYAEYAIPRKRSFKSDQKLFNSRIRDRFATLPINQISRHAVQQFHGELRELGLAPSTCDHYAKLIRRCLNLAVEWDLLEKNPVDGLKLFAADDRREVFLSPAQVSDLVDRLDRHPSVVSSAVIQLLLFSGLRVSEALNLRHRDYDLDTGLITLSGDRNKSKRRRTVPLNNQAKAILAKMATLTSTDTEYVFVNQRTGKRLQSVDKVWQGIRAESTERGYDLKHVRLHDLRHTYASMLINSGESLYTVQQILGHSDPKLTQRYAHLSSSVLQDAANSVSKYLDKAKDKQGTGNN